MAQGLNKHLAICDDIIDERECRIKRLTTTSADLPIEVLDYILMKAAVKKVMDKKLAKDAWIYYAPDVITPMRKVWSQWDYCLTTNWFKIVLSLTLYNKDATVISVKVISFASLTNRRRIGFAKLGNKAYCIDGFPGDRYWASDEGYCLNISEVHSINDTTDCINLPSLNTPDGLVACKQSNSLYFWGAECGPAVWKLIPDGNGSCETLRWIDYSLASDFVDSNKLSEEIRVKRVSVLDDGSLLVIRQVFYENNEMATNLSVHKPDGLVIRNIRLSQNEGLTNAMMKSNGNFVYAQILYYRGVVFTDIDQDGKEIREFYWTSKTLHVGNLGQLFLDSHDRVIFQPMPYHLIFLDAELNFLQEVQIEIPEQFQIPRPPATFMVNNGEGVLYADFDKETNEMIIMYYDLKVLFLQLTW